MMYKEMLEKLGFFNKKRAEEGCNFHSQLPVAVW